MASSSFPHFDDHGDYGLKTTEEVLEADEPRLSSILGPDGEPIPYASKKLGFLGFYRLKENE